MTKIIVLGVLLATLGGVASARGIDSDDRGGSEHSFRVRHHHFAAPEISADAAGGAVTLLLGALVVLRGRKGAR